MSNNLKKRLQKVVNTITEAHTVTLGPKSAKTTSSTPKGVGRIPSEGNEPGEPLRAIHSTHPLPKFPKEPVDHLPSYGASQDIMNAGERVDLDLDTVADPSGREDFGDWTGPTDVWEQEPENASVDYTGAGWSAEDLGPDSEHILGSKEEPPANVHPSPSNIPPSREEILKRKLEAIHAELAALRANRESRG